MMLFNLVEKPEFFDLVVQWLFDEWGQKKEPNNYVFWECWVKSSLSTNDIPQTYVAVDKDELIATFSLWRCDLQSRQDIFPWFGGLVVGTKYRGRGIGIQMQKEALAVLKSLGYDEVHLFTEINGYYERTGWRYIEDVPDESGHMKRLYGRATGEPIDLLRGWY